MPVITELKEELGEMITFKFIATAFTEASAVKLKKIRAMFDINRQFYDDIGHVYHLVRVNAARQKIIISENPYNQKTLFIALTSNLRFYGALNIEIIRKFIEDSERDETDMLVIGATGIEYMKSMVKKRNYDSLTFKKDNPDSEEATTFLAKIKDYYRVYVYYPKFVSLLTQSVGVTDITQADFSNRKDPDEHIHIIFEPELPKIINFFQSQVRLILFQRILLETELARTAARLLTMSLAEERTESLIASQRLKIRKMASSLTNRQLLETFAGIGQWRQH